MFSQQDFKRLDRNHFDVLFAGGYHIILKSKSTNHIWDLTNRELFEGKSTIMVFHKHHTGDEFHIQKGFNSKTVLQAQRKIIDHDRWHKGGRLPNGAMQNRRINPCN